MKLNLDRALGEQPIRIGYLLRVTTEPIGNNGVLLIDVLRSCLTEACLLCYLTDLGLCTLSCVADWSVVKGM
jgi:hypothetical protein